MQSIKTHRKWARRLGVAALVTIPLLGAGCAEERDPIDRTQPARLDKRMFLGNDLESFKDDPLYRTKGFSIDSAVNAENFAGTIGGATAVDRIRWEVTENWLFARRAYQESPGADNKGLERVKNAQGQWEFPGPANGTIVAAYRILGHFDIRRDFNPATGEETNVVVENAVDKPWQKRQYMRVDWQNIAESTSADTSWVFGGAGNATPINYPVTDESSEDRPHFEPEKGYFDITSKYQLRVEPDPSFGVPECVIVGYFNGTSSFDCTPPEVKMRVSFEKMGDEDFEAFEEGFAQRDVIGNWGNAGNTFNREYGAPPRTEWDPQYGYTDAKTKTYFSLHNIWEKSHTAKACSSNEQESGTATECSDQGSGSQCDTRLNLCTIPVRQRAVKTMGWWLNKEMPLELQDTVKSDGSKDVEGPNEQMTTTWNQLFEVSVAYRREVECRRTGGSRDACHEEFFEVGAKQMVKFGGWGTDVPKKQQVDKNRPIVTTCHNPVRAYDEAICGKPGEEIRLGDIRKNYNIYWPFASRAPYGGVASIGGDPLSGEMMGATATTMGRSVTAAAAQVRDIIQIEMGDVKVEDLIQGAQATLYSDRVQDGQVKVEGAMNRPISAADRDRAEAIIDVQHARRSLGKDVGAGNPLLEKTLSPGQYANDRASLSPAGPGVERASRAAITGFKQIMKSPVAAGALANPGMDALIGRLKADGSSKSQAMLGIINQMDARDNEKLGALYDRYMAFLGQRGVCFHDSMNAAGVGSIYLPSLAKYFKEKYADDDAKERGIKIYKELMSEVVKGIGFHEIGHALGMRHNFASSWDSLNYMPQYWQLRTNDGKVTPKPRYVEPISKEEEGLGSESRPGIEYFGNTSTMEYQIERFGETAGAGLYDQHFIKTLYGRIVETFDPKVIAPAAQLKFQGKFIGQGAPDDFVSSDIPADKRAGKFKTHYLKTASLAKTFDFNRDCRDATDEEKTVAKWRIIRGKVCASAPKDHLAYSSMKSGGLKIDAGRRGSFEVNGGTRWNGVDQDNNTLVRWPYRYGEDYSRGGYIHAKLFDSGADMYEISMNVIKRFELTYPWTYFRRLNKEFAWWSIPSSVAGNTFARLRAYHWYVGRDIADLAPSDRTSGRDDDLLAPFVQANAKMFDFMQKAILMPEPGIYWDAPPEVGLTRGNTLDHFRDGSDPDKACDSLSSPEFAEVCKKGGTFSGLTFRNIPFSMQAGRFIQTDFDNDRGGSWDYFNFPIRVGFDTEKSLALRELIDTRPSLSSVSRENALDDRGNYVSWRTDLPHALDRLVGGILSEDWDTIAPSFISSTSELVSFPIVEFSASKLVRPANAPMIFPNIGYTQQLDMAIYAMLYSRASTDLTFANKVRIRLDNDNGSSQDPAQTVVFRDPVTGYRYVATRFGTEEINGRAVERGIASRILQRANQLAAATYSVDGAPDPVTGELKYRLTNGAASIRGGNPEEFRRYVGLIDAMRQIANILGNGPLGGGGGGDE
jgi:Met-zincin